MDDEPIARLAGESPFLSVSHPQPDSDVKSWFSKFQKDDEAYQLPEPQRVAQFVEKLRAAGISITVADLVKGAIQTPSQLSSRT